MKKKIHPETKPNLHPRNKNRERYDFERLTAACPELRGFVRTNPFGDESIDFANPDAVKALNRAILSANYGLDYWDIPPGYLCPPIPGRADYIHHAADLLARSNNGQIPAGNRVRVLDIGVGANCIYPIIGVMEYGWLFAGADIDATALQSSQQIAARNKSLSASVGLRMQTHPQHVFEGIISGDDRFDLTICNPPFHASAAEAQAGSNRKVSNLSRKHTSKAELNFGGKSNELWCPGGEAAFLNRMISESTRFAKSVLWFTTLVSKSERLPGVYHALKQSGATDAVTVGMGQGNKISRFVAWTFQSDEEQRVWVEKRNRAD